MTTRDDTAPTPKRGSTMLRVSRGTHDTAAELAINYGLSQGQLVALAVHALQEHVGDTPGVCGTIPALLNRPATRAYFAGQALAGVAAISTDTLELLGKTSDRTGRSIATLIAEQAVETADALLAELKK